MGACWAKHRPKYYEQMHVDISLFSLLCALPMFLIFLKNANTVTYTISMNWSLEIARALTGGIGIVLTIPITILFHGDSTLRRAKQ